MLVNADFSQRAIVMPHQYQWMASPKGGVDRVMLDRLGGEDARATSIVRYGPGSSFARHLHPGGEEILVLSGTFSEGNDYPAGWYLRNPPGSSHAPSSADGAIIFVKLRQMAPRDCRAVRIDTRDPLRWRPKTDGEACLLYANDVERTWLQRSPPGGILQVDGDTELLLLNGDATFEGDRYPHGTWMRFPPGDQVKIRAGTEGATFYVKSGLVISAGKEPYHA